MGKRKRKPLTRSETMSRIRSEGNKPEEQFAKWMKGAGLAGFERNVRGIPGTPDFVFREKRVAIFLDSPFWHWRDRDKLPKTNTEFWRAKFEANVARDARVDETLRRDGWTVLRMWEDEVEADPERAMEAVIGAVTNVM